ncbi:hypothetical protein MIR68_004123 [Amoeboaphelidium protococcarum]|nr:hypothetical protein MIR68_004123 [Amoeboaphelidium protococcarum]
MDTQNATIQKLQSLFYPTSEANNTVLEELDRICKLYQLKPENVHNKWESLAMQQMTKENSDNNLQEQEFTEQSLLLFKSYLRQQVEWQTKMSQVSATNSSLPNSAQYSTPFRVPVGSQKKSKKLSLGGGGGNTLGNSSTQNRSTAIPQLNDIPQFASPQTPIASQQNIHAFNHQLSSVTSSAFKERQNSGKVEICYNEQLAVQSDVATQSQGGPQLVEVAVYPDYVFNTKYRYMAETCDSIVDSSCDRLAALGQQVAQDFDFVDSIADPFQASQLAVKTYGKICCDSTGKMNDQSIMLECSTQSSADADSREVKRIRLNVNGVEEYSVFPGKIVGVEGTNNSGRDVFTSSVLMNPSLPEPPSTSCSKLLQYSHDKRYMNGQPIHLAVARGPFTVGGSFDFEPLVAFLQQCRQNRSANVIVLIGPFVDEQEASLSQSDLTPMEIFNLKVAPIIVDYLQDQSNCRIVLIPSVDDAIHPHVALPQPPYDKLALFPKNLVEDVKVLNRIQCVSNPSVFVVNEVYVAVTSTDILMDLSREEISRFPSKPVHADRISRLVEDMLRQRSFYPLDPPNQSLYVSDQHQQALGLSVRPDILLLPSKLTMFAKNVHDSLVVNPGHLCRVGGVGGSQVGGTYASLLINPMGKNQLQEAIQHDPEAEMYHGVADRTCVKIMRI